MILRFLLLIQLSLLAIPTLEAGIWDRIKGVFVANEEPEPPTIRVLVLQDVSHADLAVKGTYNLYDPYHNTKLAIRFAPKGNRIQSIPAGLKWGEEFPGVYQIAVVPDDRTTLVSINGVDYRGKIYVYDVGGTVSIVNEVEIEDYLASTIPVKFPRSHNPEALAAAAIAERTHAFHVSLFSENPYWHVKANEVGYRGMSTVGFDPNVTEALASTRYMVMSKTGVYEGVVTPFPVCLVGGSTTEPTYKMSKLSIDDIESMASQGDNAARILTKSFPDASIEIMVGPKGAGSHVAEFKVQDRPSSR